MKKNTNTMQAVLKIDVSKSEGTDMIKLSRSDRKTNPLRSAGFVWFVASFGVAASFAGVVPVELVGEHGVGATMACTARCIGEATECTATIQFLDDFNDAIVVNEAWSEVAGTNGRVRVPGAGDLPILAVGGNAICTDDGGICDPVTGASCKLPCTVGGSESTVGGLPGFAGRGRVQFAQREYMIQPDDTGNLSVFIFFRWDDSCESGEPSCPNATQFTPAGAVTNVPNCNDDNPCSVDTCSEGVCEFTPECIIDAECDNGDVCTTETCVDGCCNSEPTGNDFDNDGLVDICDPDIDNDGVENDPDVCDFTRVGSDVDPTGRPLGDIDLDCDTDLDDYELFRQGLTGAAP